MASNMNPATQEAFNQGNLRANAAYQDGRRRFTIDPITRLEGHGKIDIFLDDKGDVERAYLQVPELRGFEVFAIGRPAEDMIFRPWSRTRDVGPKQPVQGMLPVVH